jgi:hypothetical protein
MFDGSPTTDTLLGYLSLKYGQILAPVGLAKACAVTSAQNTWPRFSMMNVAPEGQLKTLTSVEIMSLFDQSYWIKTEDDFTMHSLSTLYSGQVSGKCIMVNDATTLLATKSKKSKERLMKGLGHMLTDKGYSYADKPTGRFEIESENCSLVMNITLLSYERYKKAFFELTFLDRVLKIFHVMPHAEQKHWNKVKKDRMKMRFGKRFHPLTGEISVPKNYEVILNDVYAVDYSILNLISLGRAQDAVFGMARAHAALNRRKEVNQDDVDFVKMMRRYIRNPMSPNKPMILELYREGRTQHDICLVLGEDPKSYRPFVSRAIREAKQRGLIDMRRR